MKIAIFIFLMFFCSTICLAIKRRGGDVTRTVVLVRAKKDELMILGVKPEDGSIYSWQVNGSWMGRCSSEVRVYPRYDTRFLLLIENPWGPEEIEYLVKIAE